MISRENVQAIYPLLEKQRTLAFYSLQDEVDDPGFIQLRFVIRGPLDQDALTSAWQALLGRHESMRISLQSPENKPSMLVVLKHCELPVEWIDKRGDSSEVQQEYIDKRLKFFRQEGLDLSAPPVHKLLGVQTGDLTVEFCWACHHLLVDGWSAIVLLKDLAGLYANILSGTPLSPAAQSTQADYLTWLSKQDESAGKVFWQKQLKNYSETVHVTERFERSSGQLPLATDSYHTHVVLSDKNFDVQIKETAAALKVTQATIVYVAWAMYLSAITQREDIIFGTTTAGRSFDLPDSQIMTGYFANVIAKRFCLDRSHSVADCISQTHIDSFAVMQFEHVPIDVVHEYSGLPKNRALFDHLVLFENLPLNDIVLQESSSAQESSDAVTLGDFSGDLTSTYPLTLTIRPDEVWRFKYLFADRLDGAALEKILEGFPSFLSRVCSNTEHTVGQSLDWVAKTLSTAPTQLTVVSQSAFKAPKQLARNKTELAIASIWEDLLGITCIDIHEEFIALGGRSIAAVKMISQIEDKLDVKLTMLDVVTYPTIAGLAGRIDGTTQQSNWRSLIPLKPTGSKPPIIFIHAVGSHALFLRSITPYFDDDQPVIGLQLVGLDGECEPMGSIPQIAEHYLKEIQSYQPQGPYYLAAHCLGVIVTHEIIQQLEKQGQEAALFVAIDADAPYTSLKESNTKKLLSGLRVAKKEDAFQQYKTLYRRLMAYLKYRGRGYAKKLNEVRLLKFGTTLAKNQVYLEWAHEAANRSKYNYVGSPIDQKVVLIRGIDRDFEPYHMNWKEMSSELDIITLPIGHETMFTEPEVSILGEKIQQLVKQAQYSGIPQSKRASC